jgi:spore germination cell wall hydrolase CwlJ-like protein
MSALRASRVRGLGLGPRFVVSAVVPWMLASGLLISFTASAGTDATLPSERLFEREVATTGAISPAWNADMIAAGIVATPDSAHDGEPDDGSLPSLANSDGATPAVPRAVALSSVTPAPADATPIEVAAASLVLPGFSPRLDRAPQPSEPEADTASPEARHRYADLIVPEAMDKEQRCLAEAVYFEARSEPEEGQAAVAQVVLNRAKSGLYPSTVCGVVYQNRHRFMGCQFSFACEGKSLRITDAGSWQTATRIASAVIDGRTYLSEVGGATHYHADYVKPGWSRRLKRNDVIGRHIFYQLKPNQT